MSLLSKYQEQTSGLTEPLIIPPIKPVEPPSVSKVEVPNAGEMPKLDPNVLPQDGQQAPFTLPPADPAPLPNPVVPTFGDILYDINPSNPWTPTVIPRATMPNDMSNYVQPFFNNSDPSELLKNAFKPQMGEGGSFNPLQWKFGDMGEGPLGALFYALNLPFASAMGLASDLARFNGSQLAGIDSAKQNFLRNLQQSGGNLLQLGRNTIRDFGNGFNQFQQATADPSGMSFFTQALGGRAFSFSDDSYNKRNQLNPFGYVTSKLVGIQDRNSVEAQNLPETALSKKVRQDYAGIFNTFGGILGKPLQAALNIPGVSGSQPMQLPKLSDWVADRYKQVELAPDVFIKRVAGFGLDAITGSLLEGLPKKLSSQYYKTRQGVVVPEVGVPTTPTSEPPLLLKAPDNSPRYPRQPMTSVGPDGLSRPSVSVPGLPSPAQGRLLKGGQDLPMLKAGTPQIGPASEVILLSPPQRVIAPTPVIHLNGVPSNVVEVRAALENPASSAMITPETVRPPSFTGRSISLSELGDNNITVNYIPARNRAVMDWQNFADFNDFSTGISEMLNPRRDHFLSDLDYEDALNATEYIIPNVPEQFHPFFEDAGFTRMQDYTVGDGVPTNNFRRYFEPELGITLQDFRDSVNTDLENVFNAQLERQGRLSPGMNSLADLFAEADAIGQRYIEDRPAVSDQQALDLTRQEQGGQIPYTNRGLRAPSDQPIGPTVDELLNDPTLNNVFGNTDNVDYHSLDQNAAMNAANERIQARIDAEQNAQVKLFGRDNKYGLITEHAYGDTPNKFIITNPDKGLVIDLERNYDTGGTGYDVSFNTNAKPRDLYNLFKEALQLDELKDKSFKVEQDLYGNVTPAQKTRVTSLLERLGFDVGWEYQYARLDNYTTLDLPGQILSPRSRADRYNWRRNSRLAQIARFVDRPVQEFSNLRMQQIYELTRQIEESMLQDRPERFVQDTITAESLAAVEDGELLRSIQIAASRITRNERLAIARQAGYSGFTNLIENADRAGLERAYTAMQERAIPINLEHVISTGELIDEAYHIYEEAVAGVLEVGAVDMATFIRKNYPDIPSSAVDSLAVLFSDAAINQVTSPGELRAGIRDILATSMALESPAGQRLMNEISHPDVLRYDTQYREVQLSLPSDMRGSSYEARQATQSLVNADIELETALEAATQVSQYLNDIQRPLDFSNDIGRASPTIEPLMPMYIGTREVQAPLRVGDRLTNDIQRATSQARRIVENPQQLPYDVPEIISFSSADARIMPADEFDVLSQQLRDIRELVPADMVDDTVRQIYESLGSQYDLLPDGTVLNTEPFTELERVNPPDVNTAAELRAEGFNADPTQQTALDLQAQIIDDMQLRGEAAITAVDEAINRQAIAEQNLRDIVDQEREVRFAAPEDNPRRLTERSYYDDYISYLDRGDARIITHQSIVAQSTIYQNLWNGLVNEVIDALGENDVDRFLDTVTRFRDQNLQMFDQVNELYEDFASLFLELNRRQGQWLPSDIFPLLDEICN